MKPKPPPSGWPGVVGVANDIEVALPSIGRKADSGYSTGCGDRPSRAAADLFGAIKVVVRAGWVTLEGFGSNNGNIRRIPNEKRGGRLKGVSGPSSKTSYSSRTSSMPNQAERFQKRHQAPAEATPSHFFTVDANGSEVIPQGTPVRFMGREEEAERPLVGPRNVTKVEDPELS